MSLLHAKSAPAFLVSHNLSGVADIVEHGVWRGEHGHLWDYSAAVVVLCVMQVSQDTLHLGDCCGDWMCCAWACCACCDGVNLAWSTPLIVDTGSVIVCKVSESWATHSITAYKQRRTACVNGRHHVQGDMMAERQAVHCLCWCCYCVAAAVMVLVGVVRMCADWTHACKHVTHHIILCIAPCKMFNKIASCVVFSRFQKKKKTCVPFQSSTSS